MTKITFYNLIKIFGAAQATDAVESFVKTDYVLLCKKSPRTEETERRIRMAKEDPYTFVKAMVLDDSAWNKTKPVSPIYGDIGPMKDDAGNYNVICPNGTFVVNNGDYLVLHSGNHNDIEVMTKYQFKSSYFRSENITNFEKML